MFEKITFEKKLSIDSSENKYIGLKIATVSFLVALSGGLIAFLGLGKVGYWVVVVGVLGGLLVSSCISLPCLRLYSRVSDVAI